MDADGVNQLPVMADGHVVGMLTREGVIGFLCTIQELQTLSGSLWPPNQGALTATRREY